MNADGTPAVLEGSDRGYTYGYSLPTLPAGLKPCARCRKEHRLALQALAKQQTCREVLRDDAGTVTHGETVRTEGYCARYKSAEDFGMDPAFYAGSCEAYCFELFAARQRCPP